MMMMVAFSLCLLLFQRLCQDAWAARRGRDRGRGWGGAAGPEPPDRGGAEHHPVSDGEAEERGGEGAEHAKVRRAGLTVHH